MKYTYTDYKGFTLIELLVVVLIIGILAAVALPKYQMAVMKSRFVQAILLMDSVYTAQQVYYMSNARYGKFEDLDILLPEPLSITTDLTTWKYRWGSCYNDPGNYYEGYCYVKDTPLYYFRAYSSGRKYCRVYTNHKYTGLATKICLSLGGIQQANNSDYTQYILP